MDPPFVIPGPDEEYKRVHGLYQWQASFNGVTAIYLYHPFDSDEFHMKVLETERRLETICTNGDVDALKTAIEELRSSDDLELNRPTTWEHLDNHVCHWKNAYENGHWHIIAYLAQQPEFHIVTPKNHPENFYLDRIVADRAATTSETNELQRLLDIGWDINQCKGHHPDYGSMEPPTLSRVFSNEKIVRWYLSHGADPNAQCDLGSTCMTVAARIAPLSIMKILIAHGGKVKDTDLVAQAAIGDFKDSSDRMEVIEHLLDLGAPVDAIACSTWKPRNNYAKYIENMDNLIFFYSGMYGKLTALHVAVRAGNRELSRMLIRRGADMSIKPVWQNTSSHVDSQG